VAVRQLTEVPAIPSMWVAPIFALAFVQCLLLGKGNLSFQSAFHSVLCQILNWADYSYFFWKVKSLISKSWFWKFCGFHGCDLQFNKSADKQLHIA
jgi:hypothetical protein